MRKTYMERMSENMLRELKEIKAARWQTVDKKYSKPIGIHRILDGIIKTPEWPTIKFRLINERRLEEYGKKGTK